MSTTPRTRAALASALGLLALGGCGLGPSSNPRPATIPEVDEGGPELPPEVDPRREARPAAPAPGCVAVALGDVDGDRVTEVAVALPEHDGAAGAVWIYSGRSGLVLAEHRGARAGARLGAALAAVGDVDGDGVPDLLAGAPGGGRGEDGRAWVLSGFDASALRELEPPARALGFGGAVAGLADLDGDGIPELAVGARGPLRAVVFSGASGAPRSWVMEPVWLEGVAPDSPTAVIGAGDLDGDGLEEWVLGSPDVARDGDFVGALEWRSGADGGLLRTVHGTVPGARFGATLARAGDLDRDGLPDLLIGAPPFGAQVQSGRDGTPLRELVELRRDAGPTGLGTSVATIGDLDEDHLPDLAVAANAPGGGAVAVHSGASGARLGLLDFGVDRPVVAPARDVDLDGIGDLLVAFPELGLARVYSGATMSLLLQLDPLQRAPADLGMEVVR